MPVICPKCSHVRPADATNPDWQCPACGICYAKFGSKAAAPARAARRSNTAGEEGGSWGWMYKAALLIVTGAIVGLMLLRSEEPTAAAAETAIVEQQDSGAGVAVANAALRISEADASMLHSLAGKLERGCARNKYGLSEQACVARLREREDACAARTAERFPGQIGDTDRMQLIARVYVDCIFKDEAG